MKKSSDEEVLRNHDQDSTEFPWISTIDERVAIQFHERMMRQFQDNPYKPIIIHVNSYGGEVDALFSMLDTIDAIRSMAPPGFKIVTVATGKACSAGAALLAYGDHRFATPNARIMIHQIIGGIYGSQPANEIEHSESARMNARLLQIIKKSCKLNMSLTELKEKLSHNLYLTPEQAKEFGLIDIIGYPKLLEQMVYEIRVVNGETPPKKAKNAQHRRTNKKTPTSPGED